MEAVASDLMGGRERALMGAGSYVNRDRTVDRHDWRHQQANEELRV